MTAAPIQYKSNQINKHLNIMTTSSNGKMIAKENAAYTIVECGIGGYCDKYNVDRFQIGGVVVASRFTRWDNKNSRYYLIPVAVKNQAALIAAFHGLNIEEDEPGAVLLRGCDDETAAKVGKFAAELDGELTPAQSAPAAKSEEQTNKESAICPLDFPTSLDAYNYALAHRDDANPLAVAIESDNSNAPLLRSLVLNGVKVYGVWCEAMDDTATSKLYTTEAGAREAVAELEANDREAGIYEPDYYTVIEMSKYFV